MHAYKIYEQTVDGDVTNTFCLKARDDEAATDELNRTVIEFGVKGRRYVLRDATDEFFVADLDRCW